MTIVFVVLTISYLILGPSFAFLFSHASSGPVLRDERLNQKVIVEGLEFPTAMAFLGPNDILVTEKNTGKVLRIVNGKILENPLMDVNVANQAERGLLGLAVSKSLETDKTYVFLYYTESAGKVDGDDLCKKINHCEYGNPVGHRLYKYELIGNKLDNPRLLLDLPSNPGADHLGGSLAIGPDNNIYVITGDGDSCEYQSCEDSIENSVINAQTANVKQGQDPVGRGGIIRVTDDGEIVIDKNIKKGILGDDHPLDMYYAYGIRNSFGLDFDPLTGNLWDTENGPAFGDEINLVDPGFNSGWKEIQGIWPINDPHLLEPDPDDDEFIEHLENDLENIEDRLVDFGGKGNYSMPEFVWNDPVGVTAIKFLNSDRLGREYENDLFVGDINNGNVYHFDLTENRTQLFLKEPSKSMVSISPEESDDIIFGEGFDGVTDIEVGPDGYLYILSAGGSIHMITKDSRNY